MPAKSEMRSVAEFRPRAEPARPRSVAPLVRSTCSKARSRRRQKPPSGRQCVQRSSGRSGRLWTVRLWRRITCAMAAMVFSFVRTFTISDGTIRQGEKPHSVWAVQLFGADLAHAPRINQVEQHKTTGYCHVGLGIKQFRRRWIVLCHAANLATARASSTAAEGGPRGMQKDHYSAARFCPISCSSGAYRRDVRTTVGQAAGAQRIRHHHCADC
jgi:hypothetical protein